MTTSSPPGSTPTAPRRSGTAAGLVDHITAARLRATRAEHDRQQFATENLLGLLGEHQQTAQAAVDAVHDALGAPSGARAVAEAETTTAHLLRLAGRGQVRTPPLPPGLVDLIRRLSRTRAHVPLPLPRGAVETGTREQRRGSPLAVR